ncbi:MAG: hypothetical protein ACKOI2_14635 [Actinomycetota bacterium]
MDEIGACTIEVSRWRDTVVERVGFDACGDYLELFWLPVIGPTSTWLLRRLAVMVVLHPDGFPLDNTALAQSLGLGPNTSSQSSLVRSLQRLSIFGLVRMMGNRLEVRTVVPPLTMKQLARLPEHLQNAHFLWSESHPSAALEIAYSVTARIETESTSGDRCPALVDSVVSVSAS